MSRWIFAALIMAGIAFLVIQLAPQTIGETARRHLQCSLQQHYPDCRVTIRRGHYQSDIGLIFDDIRIVGPTDSIDAGPRLRVGSVSSGSESIRIDRIIVVAEFDRSKLTQQENPFSSQRLVIDGLQARTTVNDAGELAIAKFWPPPKFGPVTPRIELRNTDLQLANQANPHHPVTVQFSEILLTSDPVSGDQTIAATGSAAFASNVQMHGKIVGDVLAVQGQVRGARLNNELFNRLPVAWTSSMREAQGAHATVDATFAFSRGADGLLDYKVRASIDDGRFDHTAMPMPLTQIRGLVTYDRNGLQIQESTGKLGDALVRASGSIRPQSWPHDCRLDIAASGLLLDEQLARRLPPQLQTLWNKFQPYGHIDVERLRLQYRDGRWDANGAVRANGVNVRYEKMPYPTEQLVGRIEFAEGVATCHEMNGRVGGRHMKCAFRMPMTPSVRHPKQFRVRVDGPVAIDTTLVNALTPRGLEQSRLESFVRSLHPQGTVHLVDAYFETDLDGNPSRSIDLRVANGNLRYDKFAYPLYNVAGRVEVDDAMVKLSGFEANNSSAGRVACDGWYRMPPLLNVTGTPRAIAASVTDQTIDDLPPKLQLSFRTSEIAMDGSLRSSLSQDARLAWDAISPSGVLDQLDVIVTQSDTNTPITTDISAIQHDGTAVTNRALSLQPPALPYRLDVLGGRVRFDGRQVLINSLSTRHDATRVSADGHCVRGADGRWNLLLNILGGSRLHPDAELIAALPNQLRESMHRLQLRGPLSLRGKTRILLADASHPEPVVNWNLNLQLEGNRIGDVGPVHSVRGELETTGTSDINGLNAVGNVKIDSMHIDDLHVTSIRGPFLIEQDQLLLGSATTDQNDVGQQRRIQGNIFGGMAELSGVVALSSGKFNVTTAISRGQVPTLLSELGKGRSELSGTFNLATRLQGFLGTTELLNGAGSANVSNANLYQLPLLVQLLNLLRITPTEDVAFTDGNATFQIIENQINFNKLQLWGDLVALDGSGTMNRRRELDLTFNTRVSPQNSFTRVVRPLRNSKYTLLTVDVRGPVDAPSIQRRSFDGVSETLEKLFPVIADSKQQTQQTKSWIPSIFR